MPHVEEDLNKQALYLSVVNCPKAAHLLSVRKYVSLCWMQKY
jgi:hypothetical protein